MQSRQYSVDEKSAIRWGSSGGECDIRAAGRNYVGSLRGPDREGKLDCASVGGFEPGATLRDTKRFNGEAAGDVAPFRRLRFGTKTSFRRNHI
jgi:hypothetical protein